MTTMDIDKVITVRDLIAEATSLRSDFGENSEYDRALVELVGAFLPAGPDGYVPGEIVAAILGTRRA